jgi:excisionase family DNA binding protein
VAVEIDGEIYLSITEIAEKIGVSRQTVWRWRNDGKIPQGRRRARNRHVLFSEQEAEIIQQFAVRLDPIEGEETEQLRLPSIG